MTGQISISMSREDIQAIAAEVVIQLQQQQNRFPATPEQIDKFPANKQLLKDSEVALILGCSRVHVRHCAKEGLLPKPYKFGSNTRWKRSEILQVIDNLEPMS